MCSMHWNRYWNQIDLIMLQLQHHSWNYPDLNLNSLSNNVPLICTRAQERYSIRDPHQHTSRYGSMKRYKIKRNTICI